MRNVRIELVIISIGILVLLPFLLLCYYNHPATDDFMYANVASDLGFWEAQIYWYKSWAGSLLPSAIMSLNPLMHSTFIGYKIMPLTGLLVFILTFYYFVHTITGFSLTKSKKWTIVFAFFISYVYYLPSVIQEFYWVTSVVSYTLPTIFFMIFILQLFLINNKPDSKNKRILLLSLLIFLIMQGVESYMIFMTAFILVVFFFSVIINKKIKKEFMILIVVAILSALFVLVSPGIYIRSGAFPQVQNFGLHLAIAMWSSFKGTLGFLVHRSLLILLFSVLLLPYLDIIIERSKDTVNRPIPILHPALAFVMMIAFPMIFLFLSCWVGGGMPDLGRVPNTAYFYFLLGWLYMLYCSLSWLKCKYSIGFNGINFQITRWLVSGIIILSLFMQNNIRAAYGDLLTGRAAKYAKELNARYETISACQADTCIVPPLTIHATSLSNPGMDITTDPKLNTAYSIFFKKKVILLSSESNKN